MSRAELQLVGLFLAGLILLCLPILAIGRTHGAAAQESQPGSLHCVDSNGDGVIGVSELFAVIDAYFDRTPITESQPGSLHCVDSNGDGVIGVSELFGVIDAYFDRTPIIQPSPTPTATPVPTPTLTPQPTLTGYIPALNGHVAEMKFYESASYGYDAVPRDDRVYRKAFPRSTTRYVNGELLITFPIPDRQIDFEIDVVFYQSDGSVVARRTTGGYVNEHWGRGSDYWVFSAGSRQPSRWKAGLYRVDLLVEEKLIASKEFEIVDRQIPASGPFLELRKGLPWAREPLGLDEENALLALSSMMETDPELAVQVASLPWVRQALTLEGRNALQALDILATADADLAKRVASFSWLADGVSKDEWLSLRTLALLASTDVELADLIAGYPWLAGAEGLSVDQLRDILRESPAAVETLLDFPWLADGVTEHEKRAVSSLLGILRADPTVAKTLLAFVWLTDGVTEHERWAVDSLRGILRQDPAMAKAVLESHWFSDGVTQTESQTLRGLRNLYELDRSSISVLDRKTLVQGWN